MSWNVPGRYDFSIPESQRLSDLNGVDADLEAVVRLCTRWTKLATELGPLKENCGLEWWEGVQDLGDLGFAAVVRYGRTFGSGSRSGISHKAIDDLGDVLAKSHAYFKALRDKYIAHSLSELEDNQVFVMLNPQIGEPQVPASVTVDRGRLVGIGAEDIGHLHALSVALREVVKREMAIESEKLLAIAMRTPIEEIRARGSEPLPIPDKSAAFKVRGRFARRRGDG